jgi:hypothetical protein
MRAAAPILIEHRDEPAAAAGQIDLLEFLPIKSQAQQVLLVAHGKEQRRWEIQ